MSLVLGRGGASRVDLPDAPVSAQVSNITDGNCLAEGAPVSYVKVFDDRRGARARGRKLKRGRVPGGASRGTAAPKRKDVKLWTGRAPAGGRTG